MKMDNNEVSTPESFCHLTILGNMHVLKNPDSQKNILGAGVERKRPHTCLRMVWQLRGPT